MKKFKFLVYAVAFSFFISCSDDDHDIEHEHEHHDEQENMALLVSDVNSKTLNFIKPHDESIQTYQAKYSKGAIYATESGRYGVITHRDNNFTETFNLGGEVAHGDHSHDLGETGLAAISFESQKPTHFKSAQGYVLVYNDGDATLSLFNESSIHNNSSPVRTINTGSVAHHGAMAVYKNGSIAVTELGNGASLPESVRIINQSGEVLFPNQSIIKTSGIHGNAAGDKVAVFGSNTGVLVVKDTGEQSLIHYPDSFGDDVWFGSLLSTHDSNLFIGYTATKGVYYIDIENSEITPVYETTDLFKCIVSSDGEYVVALTKSGYLNITEIESKSVAYQGQLSVDLDTEAADHSSVTSNIDVSDEFLYVSVPSEQKIIQISLDELEVADEFNLEITPYQFKVLGYNLDH
ncbi:hypothetical protein [Wenyingzhuangia sp. IMCC45467]